MDNLKEDNCHFTNVKMTRCDECDNDYLMHEFGRVKDTMKKVKMCLCCGKITVINE